MNRFEYQKIVESFVNKAILENNLDCLHEELESSKYIIWYNYHNDILECSDNIDYALENDLIRKSKNYHMLRQQVAYWALYADILDYIDENSSLNVA